MFEQGQTHGIRSKVWGTGPGSAVGAVFDVAFPGLVSGKAYTLSNVG